MIAPITTSSPIELLTVEVVTEGTELTDTTPMLFAEDEELVNGDVNQDNHRSESPDKNPTG